MSSSVATLPCVEETAAAVTVRIYLAIQFQLHSVLLQHHKTDVLQEKPRVKSYEEIPGPVGLPIIGTSLQYLSKRSGLSFDKMFEVSL